jgi:hypothetical protein
MLVVSCASMVMYAVNTQMPTDESPSPACAKQVEEPSKHPEEAKP